MVVSGLTLQMVDFLSGRFIRRQSCGVLELEPFYLCLDITCRPFTAFSFQVVCCLIVI